MTHAVRTRLFPGCLAILPEGIAFSLLLLFPLIGYSQTPSFSTHSFSSAANNSVALHGDLNNDGYEDLIMSTNSGIRVYLSKGTGSYTALAPSINASAQVLGDFNGDGSSTWSRGVACISERRRDVSQCWRHPISCGQPKRRRGRRKP